MEPRRAKIDMADLCNRLLDGSIDPANFVSKQWTLIDLVKENSPPFWQQYLTLVNQVELQVAICMDSGRKFELTDDLKQTVERMLNLLSTRNQ